MRGIAGRRLAATIALGAIALCAFLASRLLAAKGLVWATNVTTIASFVLAAVIPLIPFLGKLLSWLHGAPPVSKVTLQQARAGLADALTRQWAEEDRLRRVNDPWPLPVRWQLVSAVQAPAQSDGTTAIPAGSFADIHAAFVRTPARRMVILGPAGAGKSVLAIKLVRDLLAARQPDDQVPVLLTAATWTRDCPMTEWIAEQLARTQPSLDARIRTDTGETVELPRALADSGVIPVIDGLDELPQDRRIAVISEINAYGSDHPLVLTSRPDEYNAATVTRGVSRAEVIELNRLRLSEVKTYLTESTAAPADRWRNVFERLDAEPDGVLASTLASPLMIWLARTVYEKSETDPDELLDPALLTDRGAVESHLVAAFVPAVYSGRQRNSQPRPFRCTPEQATRWLGFLADRLNRSRTQEIAWWRLSLAEPGWRIIAKAVRAVLYACVIWTVSIWALTRRGYWRQGGYVGHGHYQDLLLAGPLGHAVRPLTNGAVRLVAGWAAAQSSQSAKHPVSQLSSAIDSAVRGVAHLGLLQVAAIAASVGVLSGILALAGTFTPPPRTLSMTWRSLRRQVFGPLPWLAVLAFVWWRAASQHQPAMVVLRTPTGRFVLLWLALALAGRALGSLQTSIETATDLDPVTLLRADRRAYLAGSADLAVTFGSTWLWAGGVLAVARGIGSAAALLIVLLLGGNDRAWVRYLDARLRLAARGRLPWRTISFLTDAHRRGVLRQTGATYQFRHIRLQEQLAARYSPWPRLLVPAASWTSRQLAKSRPTLSALVAKAVNTTPTVDAGPTATTGSATTEYAASGEVRAASLVRSLGVPLQVAIVVTLVLNVMLASTGWIAFLVLVDLLVFSWAAVTIEKHGADSRLPPGYWSVNVTPSAIELTRAAHQITLTPDDVELIALRGIGTSRHCYAVQARLRPGIAPISEAADNWLPLYWTPGYTARIPRALISALAAFAGNRLESELADWLRRQGPIEYEASGVVQETTVSATLGSRVLGGVCGTTALTGLFLAVGWGDWAIPAIVADVILIGVGINRLGTRAARKKLPPGPWSLRVHAEAMEITRAGRSIRLTSDEVENIELRPVRGSSWGSAVHARLRSQSATPIGTSDAWFLIYWEQNLSTTIAPELVISLAGFAPGRLSGQLKGQLERARGPKAPVYREGRAAAQRAQAPATPGSGP